VTREAQETSFAEKNRNPVLESDLEDGDERPDAPFRFVP
jgi:hypothetical protein